ncbi:glycosyltransferase [uncultured Adlercreutzia sp.]|uniref:glycosyltransferase n=1 Tax=uncultured Adlercreutzia sp. TaxID=875803 RepID=UPI0026F38911|nr:glycosyltransferase [uncultured Adlercreutzia sp.]
MVRYRQLWRDLPIDENCVLIESQQGRTANGSMFYVAEELRKDPRYRDLNVWFVVKETTRESAETLFGAHNIEGINFVEINSDRYAELLASAKFLVTDTTFPTYYMRKEGQVIWNTWHGTPLKSMGRFDEEDLHKLGNVQKNLAMADYLTFANEHSYKHMVDAYMIEGMCEAEVLFAGYPRNSVFFDEDRLRSVREALLAGEDKRLYAYMPTWRPTRKGVPGRFRGIDIMHHLLLIDDQLADDEVMYVSIHPMERKFVSFDCLSHIKEFPEEFETYEVLGACDVLATDYSSVMFDFASTRKKIVQFLYDRVSYERHRGMVLSVDDLPFPKVDTVDALIAELRSPKDYDDEAFVQEFCKYDRGDVTEALCEAVFLGDNRRVEHDKMELSSKERVLIYAGNLAANGITRSLTSLLQRVDTQAKDYYLTFTVKSVEETKDYLKTLPEGVKYIPCLDKTYLTVPEKAAQLLFKHRKLSAAAFNDAFSEVFEVDRRRLYGNLDFHTVIQFNGYDNKEILMYEKFPAKRIIFAHSDTKQEAALKGNSRLDVLKIAYQNYDHVAVVSEGIVPSIKEISEGGGDIRVVPNLFDHERVEALGDEPIAFDSTTRSNVPLSRLKGFFEEGRVVVSVGRFSPEKQHKLLIDAFNEVWQADKTAHLVIIGGVSRGPLYDETCEYARSLPCRDNVALILSMSNPFAVVKASDGFILSSAYEGFGLVLLEADVLGKPVVSTDIAGPAEFVRQHGGTLVENSKEGLEKGLRLLLSGEAPRMDVDYDAYNDEALQAFLDICE